jgi:hypothetical protein
MAEDRVLRTTIFRVGDLVNQQKLLDAYKKIAAEPTKVCSCNTCYLPLPPPPLLPLFWTVFPG